MLRPTYGCPLPQGLLQQIGPQTPDCKNTLTNNR